MFGQVPTPLVVSYGSLTAQVPTGNLTGKKLPVGNLGPVIIKSNEMKASDTEHQRRRRIRNIVVKKVAECTDKDPKKRMAFDMRFLDEVLGVGQGEIY